MRINSSCMKPYRIQVWQCTTSVHRIYGDEPATMSGPKFPVFKKSSASEKVTIYVENRDVGDINSIAGVVVVDSSLLKDNSVFIELRRSFRYGHEDDEMFGFKFLINSVVASQQLYFPSVEELPPPPEPEPEPEAPAKAELEAGVDTVPAVATQTEANGPVDSIDEAGEVLPMSPPKEPSPPPPPPKPLIPELNLKLTSFQERVVRKFCSNHAFPFCLAFNGDSPSSVTLESGKRHEMGKPVGVEYFLRAYAGNHEKDYTNKNSTVQMGIRKIQHAPKQKRGKSGPVNTAKTVVKKEPFMSRGEIEMHVSLDKQIYHHGETIKIILGILNKSGKTVKKYKTLVEQYLNLSAFKNGRRRNVITEFEESEYGVPIPPNGKLNTFIHLTPTYGENKGRAGIAKDGLLRLEDGPTLASSSLFADPDDENAFGIIVSYSVKVKLYLSGFGGVVTAEVPFYLLHPDPDQGRAKARNRYRRTQSLYM